MTFNNPKFKVKDKIELLEKSIILCSCAYYEFDYNILPDYKYDRNTRQLMEFMRDYPNVFMLTKYYRYFEHFESGTGYYLMGSIRSADQDLYCFIIDETSFIIGLIEEGKHNAIQ